MSWQERIEKRKQEIRRVDENRKRVEQEEFSKCREEFRSSALRMAEDLRLGELLGEIRDQVWKLGEVSWLVVEDFSGRDQKIPFYFPLVNTNEHKLGMTAVFLRAEWPCYSAGYYSRIMVSEYREEMEWVSCPREVVHEEELCILCLSDSKGKEVFLYSNHESIVKPLSFASIDETRQEIEEALIQYYSQPRRISHSAEPPYDERAREDMERLKEWRRQSPHASTRRKIRLT